MVSDLGTAVSVIPDSTARSSLVGVTRWCQGGLQTQLPPRTAGQELSQLRAWFSFSNRAVYEPEIMAYGAERTWRPVVEVMDLQLIKGNQLSGLSLLAPKAR